MTSKLAAPSALEAIAACRLLPVAALDTAVGGGDSFASGLIFGTTPGDTSMATHAEIERLAANAHGPARIER
jgi:sugar/nucleoside kinase (ribokinase family)